MAQELHKRLDDINRQLKKLDNIEATVIEVRASLQKLEVRIQNLESSQATASHEIENLKTSLSDAAKKRQESAECLEKYQKETKQALTNLQKEKEAFQARFLRHRCRTGIILFLFVYSSLLIIH